MNDALLDRIPSHLIAAIAAALLIPGPAITDGIVVDKV